MMHHDDHSESGRISSQDSVSGVPNDSDSRALEEIEPTFEALKEHVDALLAVEKNFAPEGRYSIHSYPSSHAINQLMVLLVKAGGCDFYRVRDEMKAVYGGIAVSPNEAFLCVLDYIRTSRFIAGACDAIREAKKRFPGQRIRVVDAGCGPLGILSLAAMTQFSPEEVGFTLIDVFGVSLSSVKQIISTLHLEAYCDGFMERDAAEIQLPEKPHVVISEVVDRALVGENQVPVMLNLAPQMEPDGIFVPQLIQVDARLIFENREIVLGKIVEVTKKTSLAALGASEIHSISGIRTTHSFPLPEGFSGGRIFLSTHIHIFGEHELGHLESAITMPFDIGNFECDQKFTRTFTLLMTYGGVKPHDTIMGRIE